MRLDPRSGMVRKTIHLGGTPGCARDAGGKVWVAIAPAARPPPRPAASPTSLAEFDLRRSTRRSTSGSAPSPTRPARTSSRYPDKPAPEGSRIVPEVAEAVPTPTAGGTTYTFTIRPGFRFSPPSNQPVTATTFKSTIERVADPRLKSPFASQLSGIAGYHDYVTRQGARARGRRRRRRAADDQAVTAGRRASSPTSPAASACAVPRGTPGSLRAGSTTSRPPGPYYVASYTPRQQLVLKRNPNYHGDRPHHLDQIVVTIGVDTPARSRRSRRARRTTPSTASSRRGARLESLVRTRQPRR